MLLHMSLHPTRAHSRVNTSSTPNIHLLPPRNRYPHSTPHHSREHICSYLLVASHHCLTNFSPFFAILSSVLPFISLPSSLLLPAPLFTYLKQTRWPSLAAPSHVHSFHLHPFNGHTYKEVKIKKKRRGMREAVRGREGEREREKERGSWERRENKGRGVIYTSSTLNVLHLLHIRIVESQLPPFSCIYFTPATCVLRMVKSE